MVSNHDRILPIWFLVYALGIGVMYFSIARLFALSLMPRANGVFLSITPTIAVAVLRLGVRSGRFSFGAVLLFYFAAIALGLFLAWLTWQLLATV